MRKKKTNKQLKIENTISKLKLKISIHDSIVLSLYSNLLYVDPIFTFLSLYRYIFATLFSLISFRNLKRNNKFGWSNHQSTDDKCSFFFNESNDLSKVKWKKRPIQQMIMSAWSNPNLFPSIFLTETDWHQDRSCKIWNSAFLLCHLH